MRNRHLHPFFARHLGTVSFFSSDIWGPFLSSRATSEDPFPFHMRHLWTLSLRHGRGHEFVGSARETSCSEKRELCIDHLPVRIQNLWWRERLLRLQLLVRIRFVVEMIRWTGLAPWEFGLSFPGSLTFLSRRSEVAVCEVVWCLADALILTSNARDLI